MTIHRDAPAVEWLQNAVFVPKLQGAGYEADPAWGLYRSDGSLCATAAYRRGPSGDLVGQSPELAIGSAAVGTAPDVLYVYCGPMFVHFGHFLVTSLARLWLRLRGEGEVKLLFHGDADPDHWFEFEFVRTCLSALGFGPADIVQFDAPVRLARVICPGAAFEESGFAHAMFADFGADLGGRITAGAGAPSPTGAVYLSKRNVKSGVWRIVNEADIEAHLQARGVRIVCPDRLPLAEQIRCVQDAKVVMGTASSALHVSLLCAGPLDIHALSPSADVVANYALIDAIKSNTASYHHPDEVEALGADGAFQANYRVIRPERVAKAYLESSRGRGARP